MADATIEVARFASCICIFSDEEATDFICSPQFLHFMCNLTADNDADNWPLIRLHWCYSSQQHVDQKVQHPVPKIELQLLVLWTEKCSEERKATKTMKYVVKDLLPMSGSKTYALSLAQMERHSVTNWCPVALIGAIAGSTWRRSKQNQRNETAPRNQTQGILIWNYQLHRQKPAPATLCSARGFQIQLGWLLTR